MRDRPDAEVLASLEPELRDDPVVQDLVGRMARCDRAAPLATPAAPRSARTVLVAGLALMLLGCVALSPTAAGAGVLVALAGLALAAHRSGRAGSGTRGVPLTCATGTVIHRRTSCPAGGRHGALRRAGRGARRRGHQVRSRSGSAFHAPGRRTTTAVVAAWLLALLAACSTPGEVPRTRADVPYAYASPAQRFDLWLPEQPRPAPLVIFVHGGGFVGGDKRAVRTKVAPLLGAGAECRRPQIAQADADVTTYLGADVDTVPELAARSDPVTYLPTARSLPPFSIAHGTADCRVPPAQSRTLAEALRRAGATPDERILPGFAHGDPRFESEVMTPTITWLDGVLAR